MPSAFDCIITINVKDCVLIALNLKTVADCFKLIIDCVSHCLKVKDCISDCRKVKDCSLTTKS